MDDEIFAKRHAKPEQEEKRRKRWDMQRMREQRLYEKLQGKKQQRIAPIKLTKSGKSQQEAESPPESFIPDPDDGTFTIVEPVLNDTFTERLLVLDWTHNVLQFVTSMPWTYLLFHPGATALNVIQLGT